MDSSTKKRKMEENGAPATATEEEEEEEEEDQTPKLSPEDIHKLIEGFSQDQFMEILKPAAIKHSDVMDAVRSIVDLDHTKKKLFIRGLGWETTSEKIVKAFSGHGVIDEAIVITDKSTGKSRGYGFITFRHVDGALLALKEPSKKIDGRMTVTQLASSGGTGNTGQASSAAQPPVDISMRKIYVANVPFDMPPDRLLSHFSAFGEVEEGPLGFDKQTGKSRGFALFVFKTNEAANSALVNPVKNIDGHQLMCKMAMDPKKRPLLPPLLPQLPLPGGDLGQIQTPVASNYGFSSGVSPFGLIQSVLPLNQHQLQPTTLGIASAPVQSAFSGGSYGGGAQYGILPGGAVVGGSSNNIGGSINPSVLSGSGGSGVSSLYGRAVNTASYGGEIGRMPAGGAVSATSYGGETGHYSLSSSSGYASGYSGQLNQTGASPAPRVPTSALYQGLPHYF